jgi:RNA polymerase sigma factor (sigma-70 family)
MSPWDVPELECSASDSARCTDGCLEGCAGLLTCVHFFLLLVHPDRRLVRSHAGRCLVWRRFDVTHTLATMHHFQEEPPGQPLPAASGFDFEAALAACARGERFALRAIYEAEGRWLLGVARRIVIDRELAEDVLQDAFLQIWQKAGSFQPALGSGRGWIYTVVRHRALDEARKRGREQPLGDALTALMEEHGHAHAPTESAMDARALGRCMAQLEPRKQAYLAYAYVEGWSHDQISERLSVPLGTVKSSIRRALLALKECLS